MTPTGQSPLGIQKKEAPIQILAAESDRPQMHQVLFQNSKPDLSIISSEDSIAARKRILTNLQRDFDGQRLPEHLEMSSKLSEPHVIELSTDRE